MSVQDIVNLVRSFFDAVNQHDADKAMSFLDKNVVWFTAISPDGTTRGTDSLKQTMQNFWTAFPDNRVEITNLIATDEWVTVEYVGRGTHKAPFNTPYGQVPPTGHRMEIRFCDVYHIKNGKIVRGDNFFDMASLLQQLGVMPKIGQRGGLTM